jgi:ligand-binding sensor domain-containing protein
VRRSVRMAAFALGIVSAGCQSFFALDPSLDISQYAHTSWTVRDGFAAGTAFAMAQTPDGYLWLGTEFGLVGFDGVRRVFWQPPAADCALTMAPTALWSRATALSGSVLSKALRPGTAASLPVIRSLTGSS